jgi:hypothetical protein
VDGASGGEPKLANVLKNAPEISAWGEANGSISVQERQPLLRTKDLIYAVRLRRPEAAVVRSVAPCAGG